MRQGDQGVIRLLAQPSLKEARTDRPNLLRHRLAGTQVISTWFPIYSISLRVSLSPKGPEERNSRDRALCFLGEAMGVLGKHLVIGTRVGHGELLTTLGPSQISTHSTPSK